MKLHLPKQLFTALITAVTLAVPAAVTLGSAAWGTDGYVDEPVLAGNCWADDYSFVFVWDGSSSADIGSVLTFYRGSATNDTYGYNAWSLDTANRVLTVGRGKATDTVDGATGINESTGFTYQEHFDFTTKIEAGVVYYVSVTGGDQAMTPSITKVTDATGETGTSYNGNMNGYAALTVASNSNYMVAADSIIWKSDSQSASRYAFSSVKNWITVQGSAVTDLAGKNLIFDASSDTDKTVNLSGTYAVNSMAVYGNYTFNATTATTLTATSGITIASGKSLTLQGDSAITLENTSLSGSIVNNGTLNLAGIAVAEDATATISGTGTTTLTGTITNDGELILSGSNSSGFIKTDAAVTKNDDNSVTHTGATINNAGHIDMSGLYIAGSTKGDKEGDANAKSQYTSLINSIVGGTVLLNSGNFALQLGGMGDSTPAAVDFRSVYTVGASSDTADDGSLTLANYSSSTLWRVSEGGGLNVNKTLRIANNQDLYIAGGSVCAGDIKLAHDSNDNPGATLTISSGSLKTSSIRVEQHNASSKQTKITMTGGSLEFTASGSAITVEDNTTAPEVSITGGTLISKVSGGWTLDATGWNKTPDISNVTIDGENTGSITLKGVNLGGTITNNSSLTIAGVTVVENSSVTIAGSGTTTLAGAITNNGTLTLNGTLDVQDVSTMVAKPEGDVTYAGGQVEGNGFRSQEYILIQGGSIKYDEGFELLVAGSAVTPKVQSSSELSAAVRDGSFHVFTGAETIASTAATSYYVAEGGTLTFSDALTGARTMDITGTGTVAITIGDTSGHGNTLTASNFKGVLQISKDAAGNGNVNLNNFGLHTSASFKLVSGNHWSGDGQKIRRAIELAGEGVDDFAFRHNGSLELSGKVTGTYLTAGRNYGSNGVSNADNNLTLSGDGSNIGRVTMYGGTLTVNDDETVEEGEVKVGMTFGTLSAKNVTLGSNAKLNVGSGNVEGLLTLGTNASLTVSNGTLNLLGGVSSAADSADSAALPSITGNVGIASTLQVDGYLTMNGSVTLSGDLATNYTSYKNATETYMLYALNKETGSYEYVETASGNGFLKVNGASYWLTQGENGGITLNGITEGQTTVRHGEADYTLYRDNGGDGEGTSGHYYFLVSENTGTVYYVTAGSVDVDSAVQGKATGYVLNTADPDNEAIMNIKDGKVNTSLISYTSGKINLKAGAVLNVDAETNNMTVGGLLSGIVTAEDAATSKLVIAQSGLNTGDDGLVTTFNGTVELAQGVTFTFGSVGNAKDAQVVNTSSLAGVILNDNSVLQFQGTGDNSSVSGGPSLSQFRSVTVNGAAKIHLIDTQNSDEQDAVYLTGTTTLNNTLTLTAAYDGRIIIDNLEGSGTLSAQGTSYNAPQGYSGDQFYTTINGLNGFSGTLDFTDTSKHTVVVNTGTDAESVSFNKLQFATGSGVSNTFNVQTDTTVGTIKGACTIDIAETGTLHTFTKEGTDTITLTGSGTYDLGSSTDTNVSLDSSWQGIVAISNTNMESDNGILLSNYGNANSTIQLENVVSFQPNALTDRTCESDIKLVGEGWKITDGWSTNYDANNETTGIKFTGDFSGDGKLQFVQRNNNSVNHRYIFTGDLSAWTGAIEHTSGGANMNVYLVFKDDVSEINTSITGGVGTLNLTADADVHFTKDVDVTSVTVKSDKTATVSSTLKAGTVTNNGQIQLGKVVTSGETKETQVTATISVGSMSKVQMSSAGISSSDETGSTRGALSNAAVQIAQLAQDATFTIEDMTLTNTTVTAADVNNVRFDNVTVEGRTVLKMQAAVQMPSTVGMGGTAVNFETSSYSGITLNTAATGNTLAVDLGDLSCLAHMGPGESYELSITLNGLQFTNYDDMVEGSGVLFTQDSWLGKLLEGQGATQFVADAETGAPVGSGGGGVSVSYSAATGGNVGTIITITGLNVPEPTTATLSLLALAALAARRRRQA